MAARPSATIGAAAAPRGAGRLRAALEFSLAGDLRFLAHHDELRLLTRALVRAGWPLAYSQGFNPRPRLVLPLPRNLGVAAERQLALVELSALHPPAELFASLARQLPTGCRLLRVVAPAAAGMPAAMQVAFEVDLDPADAAPLAPRIAALLARPVVTVARDYGPGKPTRPVDIRPYINKLESEGCRLRMELRCAAQRTARPAEVITELGLAAATYNHRFRRAAVLWSMELAGPAFGPAANERTGFDYEEDPSQEDHRCTQDGRPEAQDQARQP